MICPPRGGHRPAGGLAQEKPDEAIRIARLLSIYVRELSQHPAKPVPTDVSPEDLRRWAKR